MHIDVCVQYAHGPDEDRTVGLGIKGRRGTTVGRADGLADGQADERSEYNTFDFNLVRARCQSEAGTDFVVFPLSWITDSLPYIHTHI